jgi:hypothetical protein
LLFGPHNASLIQTQRTDEAPGGREQREFTVDARSSPSNDEKGWACALQKLTFRTGQIVQTGTWSKKRLGECFARAFLLTAFCSF